MVILGILGTKQQYITGFAALTAAVLKIELFIVTAVRTLNPTWLLLSLNT
jgi:hypothetical protein